jgi:hypothetical protein
MGWGYHTGFIGTPPVGAKTGMVPPSLELIDLVKGLHEGPLLLTTLLFRVRYIY